MSNYQSLELRINGERRKVSADPASPLVFVLRNHLGLTGTKLGCGLEQCGSCAVLVDGTSRMSCTLSVGDVVERDIVTVEGVGARAVGARLRKAFADASAAQCGYCIPGIVVALTALFEVERKPDDATIRAALEPHLCRCGSHQAVLRAARAMAADQ